MEASILSEINNNVGYIKLNRPNVLNSFNKEMALKFQAILDDFESNSTVRSILITGNGRAFSAGQDLAEVTDPKGPELTSIVKDHYNPIIMRIRTIEKPILAAVNGVAAGAGANIALACDIVVATESSSFIQAFSKIGLIPDSGGTYTLPRLIGLQKATALMFLGDKIPASQAEQMGMIYKVVGDEQLLEVCKNMAETLAKMPTYGIGLTKRALNLSLSNTLKEQLEVEEDLQTKAGQSHDYNEGVSAFLEKRKANFLGK